MVTRSAPAIRIAGLGKCYHLYAQPQDRLKQFLWRGRRQFFREFWALRSIDLEIHHGDVVGIVGRNGAGKSTLLQLLCGTLEPTIGKVAVDGRIAALLELGAGFNPEFSGRENVWMNAAILGLTDAEIADRFDDIVAFSEIGDFIDQPVKTYSSGMFVRLAFAVAVHVDPDILIIDEALSVGDGVFARKSFERIMALKDAGKTILFCSHSLYQIEAICNKALWLHQGQIRMAGDPAEVLSGYKAFLDGAPISASPSTITPTVAAPAGGVRIDRIEVAADGLHGRKLMVKSQVSELRVSLSFSYDPALPLPHAGVAFTLGDGTPIASVITRNDGVAPTITGTGQAKIEVAFDNLPLLKGSYWVYACLLCENAIHVYEEAPLAVELTVTQDGLEQGYVHLPHRWISETLG